VKFEVTPFQSFSVNGFGIRWSMNCRKSILKLLPNRIGWRDNFIIVDYQFFVFVKEFMQQKRFLRFETTHFAQIFHNTHSEYPKTILRAILLKYFSKEMSIVSCSIFVLPLSSIRYFVFGWLHGLVIFVFTYDVFVKLLVCYI